MLGRAGRFELDRRILRDATRGGQARLRPLGLPVQILQDLIITGRLSALIVNLYLSARPYRGDVEDWECHRETDGPVSDVRPEPARAAGRRAVRPRAGAAPERGPLQGEAREIGPLQHLFAGLHLVNGETLRCRRGVVGRHERRDLLFSG